MAWEDSSRPSLRRFPIPFHTSCISTIHVCLLESQAEGGQQRHFSFSQSPRQMEQFHFLHRRSVGLLCMCIAFIAFSLFTLLAIFPFTPLQHHLPASWLQNSLSANPSFSDGYRNEREIFCPPPSMPFPDPLPDASVKEGSDAYGAELLLSSNGPSPVQSSLSPSSMPPSALSVGTQASSSSINSSLQRFAVIADPNSQSISSCDLSNGEWVLDGEHYPLYQPDSCPYVDESFNCQQNGRPDSKYLQWRWKPKGCALPRFDARSFLQKLRGKRMIFAGDSLMRNQWESMLCLLREGLNNKSHMFEMKGSRITKGKGDYVFKFPDYNARVEFYRSHFLVAEGKQRTSSSGKSRLTLRLDTIDKTSRKWLNADILIFTTGHWWNHGKTARGKDYFQEGDVVHHMLPVMEAFGRAMKTWATWVDENVNMKRTKVFFSGYSPSHFNGGQWDSGGQCNKETEPISKELHLTTYPEKMLVIQETIRQMKHPVQILNVTRLSDYRKDAHPSVYGQVPLDDPKGRRPRQDCSHWCLPGVPDIWNEILFAYM